MTEGGTGGRRTVHPVVAEVTARIVERSRPTRDRYLALLEATRDRGSERAGLACGNLAHAFAASGEDKPAIRAGRAMNIGIVTAYNDMLSAHQPYGAYPDRMKLWAREVGATAQVAGGVPAMCDGVTQGQPGMELSLFSRDTIALSTAIGLSHAMFEGVALLGICDKIVPGLLIGALRFGHLPQIFVPAGPMPSGLANKEKQRIRQLYAEGKVGREELLESESASYHGAGTCTFYGTANSNQMMMEVMGLHMPGAAFVNPGTKLRQAVTRAAVHRLTEIGWAGDDYRPIGLCVDEKAIVNACVGLLATGGSTNHAIHIPAIARAAGIVIDWEDLDRLSGVVPLVARVYPNGSGDVNHFQAAGGMAWVIHTLLDAGLLHRDILTVAGRDLGDYAGRSGAGRRDAGLSPGPARAAGRYDAAAGGEPVPARWRDAAGAGQSGARHVQDECGRSRPLDDRGTGTDLPRSGSGACRVQGTTRSSPARSVSPCHTIRGGCPVARRSAIAMSRSRLVPGNTTMPAFMALPFGSSGDQRQANASRSASATTPDACRLPASGWLRIQDTTVSRWRSPVTSAGTHT